MPPSALPFSLARAVLACAAALALVLEAPHAFAGDARDLERARVLDQQGVRAYKEERYNDAIRYFTEALRLGGPPSELWNIAKCHARLDEPKEASEALEQYLAEPGLSSGDR